MPYPLRGDGLQIDSVLSMGNSLYAVLVGIIVSVLAVVFTNREMGMFGTARGADVPWLWCGCMLAIVVLWVLYYMIDWHDLNRVPFFDTEMGMAQMLKYFACIFLISMCITFAILGMSASVAILTSVYCPIAIRFRNGLIDAPPQDGTLAEAFNHGKKVVWGRMRVSALNGAYFVVCGAALIAGVASTLTPSQDAPRAFAAPIGWGHDFAHYATLLVVGIALAAKYHRSTTYIERSYRNAIGKMMAANLRPPP